MFKNKVLMITGGTGSFGNQVLEELIDSDLKKIIVFSRDESKQDDMRRKYNNKKIEFIIGDVRDYNSIFSATSGVDFIFHAAALKQVPSCEFFPLEAVKTNVIGTENVLEAAVQNKIKCVVVLSTDKAAYPVNAMGISKALMEKVTIAKARQYAGSNTRICITRYGNVLFSRGSVVPLFIENAISNKSIPITNGDMTRFIMTLHEAMQLVLFAFNNCKGGEIFIQKSPSCTIDILAESIIEMFAPGLKTHTIGLRHGEKMFEVLMTGEEAIKATEYEDYYKILPDFRSLNYEKYLTDGDTNINQNFEYNSNNTRSLSKSEVITKLLEVPEIKKLYHEMSFNRT